jgi:putative transposase
LTEKKTGRRISSGEAHPGAETPGELVDRLAGLLPADALQDALRGLGPEEITGPGGLMTQLAGRVIDAALAGELTDHLGYPPGAAPPGGTGNHRNGSIAKTVHSDLGPVAVNTPRDRQGTFEPKLVGKRQTRLAGLDEKILSLYAGGMSVRDISEHLSTLYGTEIGRDTISRVTDAVLQDIAVWRSRPLEQGLPDRVFRRVDGEGQRGPLREDAGACYLAIGVTMEGEREVLGIWWQETERAPSSGSPSSTTCTSAASRTS